MRSIGSELLSVAEVLAVPLMIAAAFPRDAIGFSASRGARRADGRTASIVFLDDTVVTRAVRAARTVSRSEDGARAYIELFTPELPDAEKEPAAAIEFRPRPSADPSAVPIVESGVSPFLPSRRAAAPVRISGEEAREEPPFPRNELLKLN